MNVNNLDWDDPTEGSDDDNFENVSSSRHYM